MMAWSRCQTLLAGLVAVALVSGAIGPCVCLLSDHGCHRASETPSTHSCCQKPNGVSAVADGCCEGGSVLVMATTEVPEVGPPVLQSSMIHPVRTHGQLQRVVSVRLLPPLPLERTTVLLI
jgi:hypothetical protein